MQLIYAKGACSLSVHIMLEELGKRYESLQVSLKDKAVLETYNEKSYVPALVLNDGKVLTEAISILQYLADLNHRTDLLPDIGSMERAKTIEWLVYFSSELHKGIGPLFHRESLSKEYLEQVLMKIDKRLTYLDKNLKGQKFIMGEEFTVADMYAIAILRIGEHVKVDYSKYPEIARYKKALEELPVIKKVIEAENEAPVAQKAA
jgi:glutathione S-transferase